jgi:hypothetical protein
MKNQKLITVSIDPETAEFTVLTTGFNGHGCADVVKMFDGIGHTIASGHTSEYNAKPITVNTVKNKA